jgi:hypothetical protein
MCSEHDPLDRHRCLLVGRADQARPRRQAHVSTRGVRQGRPCAGPVHKQGAVRPAPNRNLPPPGPNRRHSFFAKTTEPSEKPARHYVGLVAPGRGPKLIFLRVVTTWLAAAEKEAAAWQRGGPLSHGPFATSTLSVNWEAHGVSSETKCGEGLRVTAQSGAGARRSMVLSRTGVCVQCLS